MRRHNLSVTLFSALMLTILTSTRLVAQNISGQDLFQTTDGSLGVVDGTAYIGIDNYSGSQTINTSPTVTLNNTGSIGGGIEAYNQSIVNATGGSAYYLSANDASTFNINGGNFTFGFASGIGALNLHGGTFSDSIYAYDASVVSIDGGTLGNAVYVNDDSTLNLYGTGLTATLLSYDSTGFATYQLSGLLSDRSSVSGVDLYLAPDLYGNRATVNLYNGASVTTLASVPEPVSPPVLASAVLLCGGMLVFRKRR